MNPLRWKQGHQVGLIISAFLGAILFVMSGWFAFGKGFWDTATHNPILGFTNYLTYDSSALWYGAVGALIGAAFAYVAQLFRA